MKDSKAKSGERIGGSFLIEETDASGIFIPENLNEEQKMIADMAEKFLKEHVMPKIEEIDAQEKDLMVKILNKGGELGLLGLDIPEVYDGYGKDLITSMYITDILGAGHSFPVAWAAHTGIGVLPILFFGNEDQKKKYLPKMASGKWKGAYCLTEPDSGSDAMAAKSKAVKSKDGKHYVLNGQKMWITNAGFADIFIVFAKINGEDFSAFIVERGFEGISFGEEEAKMGIKGSSTRQVFFSDCKIPIKNLLGEAGKGHKIAFNILNIGRLKLAAATMGAAKSGIRLASAYAKERKQFGKAIAEFGAIKHKIAMQTAKVFACESAIYRVTNDIQQWMEKKIKEGDDEVSAKMSGAEEFAIECAILKVNGSETLDYVVDESVQVFGGYGFSADYPVERAYRDSRINRIFEGTNEINRLLITAMLLKRAMKGSPDLLSHAKKVQKELTSIPDLKRDKEDEIYAEEKQALKMLKKSVLMTAGYAAQKYMQKLEDEQEIMMHIADMIIQIYVFESAILRAEACSKKEIYPAEALTAVLKILMHDAIEACEKHGRETVFAMSEADEQKMLLMGLKRYTKAIPSNLKEERRKLANFTLKQSAYPFKKLN